MKSFKRSAAPSAAYQAREVWIAKAMAQLRRHFADCSYTIPAEVRVSCGWPLGRKKAIGQAWSSTASRDKHHEIFVSPVIDKPTQVLAILVHELVHVTVGVEAGHRGHFVECARKVGLMGPWTATTENDALAAYLKRLAADLGPYPHASLERMTTGKKKQTTRLVKAHCTGCTYTIRAAMSWLLVGMPTCPNADCIKHGEPFEIDVPEPPE